jgi:hypothetical protein
MIKLLKNSIYNGENEEMIHRKLLTYDEFLSQIPASDVEIQMLMKKEGIIEMDGYMRIISKKYCLQTSIVLIDTIMINDWNIDHIDEEECKRELADVNPIILKFVLQQCGDEISTGIWSLNNDHIARITAHNIFSSDSRKVSMIVNSQYYHELFLFARNGRAMISCLHGNRGHQVESVRMRHY